MKIVVLDGYTENPGDLSWEPLKALGELTVYDRTPVHDNEEISLKKGLSWKKLLLELLFLWHSKSWNQRSNLRCLTGLYLVL